MLFRSACFQKLSRFQNIPVNLASIVHGFFFMWPVISGCNILSRSMTSCCQTARFCRRMLYSQASRAQGIYPAAIFTPLALVISSNFWQDAFFRHVILTCEGRSHKTQSQTILQPPVSGAVQHFRRLGSLFSMVKRLHC